MSLSFVWPSKTLGGLSIIGKQKIRLQTTIEAHYVQNKPFRGVKLKSSDGNLFSSVPASATTFLLSRIKTPRSKCRRTSLRPPS